MVSNDYILLHSNARGELNDPRWKIRIYENVASPQEILTLIIRMCRIVPMFTGPLMPTISEYTVSSFGDGSGRYSEHPHVAVVILTWNGREFLKTFLPSVLASTYPSLDIIVADNSSR